MGNAQWIFDFLPFAKQRAGTAIGAVHLAVRACTYRVAIDLQFFAVFVGQAALFANSYIDIVVLRYSLKEYTLKITYLLRCFRCSFALLWVAAMPKFSH